jgi:hypothetical protein
MPDLFLNLDASPAADARRPLDTGEPDSSAMPSATQLPCLHDYEVTAYLVDGESRTIRFTLSAPKGSANRSASSELLFRDVEGYLFERNLGTGVVLAAEERSLTTFLTENEEYFAHESQWGWPQFWRGSADLTATWLTSHGCRVWKIATSYGLSGWIVAGNATFHNSHA